MTIKTKKNILWGCFLVGTLLCMYMLYFRRATLSEVEKLLFIFLPLLGLLTGNYIEKRKYKNERVHFVF